MVITIFRYDSGMLETRYEKVGSWNIAIGAFAVTVIVWAYFTNDPVNTPKLTVLGGTAFISLGLLLTQLKLKPNRFLDIRILCVSIFFIFWAFASIVLSSTKFIDGFFGTWGRNTGFLAYFCFALLLLSTSTIRNILSIKRVLTSLYFAGVANAAYFLLSLIGVQLIPWNNPYNRILGTFGNPNFIGAFMGFFAVLLISRLLSSEFNVKSKMIDLVLLCVSVYEIKLSLASQGVVILFGGSALLGFLYIRNHNYKILLWFYTSVVSLIAGFALAGALNNGPLASFIYKPSLTFRGQYWQSAWNAGIDHPMFGIGLDSLGFWYGRYRTPGSIVYPGPETTTNAAHNVYLDVLASGGFPLFMAYIAMTLLVLVKALRILWQPSSTGWIPTGLVTVWFCFQAQSLISINQIGIAIWGWILGGLILGYPISGSTIDSSNVQILDKGKRKNKVVPSRIEQFSLMPGLIFGLIGMVIAWQPMRADMNWNKAIRPINPDLLQSQAKSWPLSYMRLLHASSIYTANGRPDIGLELAKFASKEFPDVWMVWDLMLKNPNINQTDKERALTELRRIDPLNPNYKK